LSSINFRAVVAVLAIAVAVVGGHLLPGLNNSAVEDGIRNGLHVLVFAVFGVIVFESLKSTGAFSALAITLVIVATTGALSEGAQYLTGRHPDVFDVVRDVAGAVFALIARLLWRWCGAGNRSRLVMLAGRSVAIALGAMIAAPFLFWFAIVALGRISAPVVLDFDQWWNKYIYRPINAEIIVPGEVAGAVEILLRKSILSGVVISPMLTDWSDYETMVISAHMLKGSDTNVTVRINDSARRNSWSDEFLVWTVLGSDKKAIRIPLDTLHVEPGKPSIDLSDIQELVIFAREPTTYDVMLIDEIRLE
jgi:VanZ family protein